MFPKFCRKLLADRSGATAIMIAVMAAALIGFTSLGTEVVLALRTQRTMQTAAVSAAISAANAQGQGYPSPYTQEAYGVAAQAGFVNGQNGVTVTPSSPPNDGTYAGQSGYVEVLITQPLALRLAKVVYSGTFHLHGRGAARAPFSSNACTLALAPTGAGTLFLNGNAVVDYNNCNVGVNSTTACGLNIVSSGNNAVHLTATNIYAGGTICSDPTKITVPPPGVQQSGAPPELNPYADVVAPSLAAGTVRTVSGNKIANPGSYSTFNGSNVQYLCPGVYVVGSISLAGKKSLSSLSSDSTASDYTGNFTGLPNFATDCPGNTATGVTVFVTGSVSLTGQASLILTPETAATLLSEGSSATYAGLVLYSATGNFTSCGGLCTTNLTGAVVFPNGTLKYNGNGSDSGHACTELIASTIEYVGNATLGADCAGFGVKPIKFPATLVEYD